MLAGIDIENSWDLDITTDHLVVLRMKFQNGKMFIKRSSLQLRSLNSVCPPNVGYANFHGDITIIEDFGDI